MTRLAQVFRIRLAARLASVVPVVLLACGPAAASQSRSVLSVTATVVPSCEVALRPETRTRSSIECSSETSWSTVTAPDHASPLAEAETILGEPVRRDGRLVFTSAVRPAVREAGDASTGHGDGGTPYLTITY